LELGDVKIRFGKEGEVKKNAWEKFIENLKSETKDETEKKLYEPDINQQKETVIKFLEAIGVTPLNCPDQSSVI
jgi:hypothetical protein